MAEGDSTLPSASSLPKCLLQRGPGQVETGHSIRVSHTGEGPRHPSHSCHLPGAHAPKSAAATCRGKGHGLPGTSSSSGLPGGMCPWPERLRTSRSLCWAGSGHAPAPATSSPHNLMHHGALPDLAPKGLGTSCHSPRWQRLRAKPVGRGWAPGPQAHSLGLNPAHHG